MSGLTLFDAVTAGVVGALTRLAFAALPRAFSPYFYRCDSCRPPLGRSRRLCRRSRGVERVSRRSRQAIESGDQNISPGLSACRLKSHISIVCNLWLYSCKSSSRTPHQICHVKEPQARPETSPRTGCERLSPAGKHRAPVKMKLPKRWR
jgi:hypothetical protein